MAAQSVLVVHLAQSGSDPKDYLRRATAYAAEGANVRVICGHIAPTPSGLVQFPDPVDLAWYRRDLKYQFESEDFFVGLKWTILANEVGATFHD
jgi:hypothetical protein